MDSFPSVVGSSDHFHGSPSCRTTRWFDEELWTPAEALLEGPCEDDFDVLDPVPAISGDLRKDPPKADDKQTAL